MMETIKFSNYGAAGGTVINNKIAFSRLNVFAGQNDSGKSLLFKAAWFMQFTLQIYKIGLLMQNIPRNDEAFLKDLESVADLTWSFSEQISGTIEVTDNDLDPSYIYMIQIDHGKVLSFNIDVVDFEKFAVGEINQISYNTRDARTFTQYETYIKLCKKFDFNITKIGLQSEALKEMGEFYRIYDMMWFERVRNDIKAYNKGGDRYMERLKLYDAKLGAKDEFPKAEQLLFKKDILFVDDELGNLKRASEYGTGIQILLMMTLFGF